MLNSVLYYFLIVVEEKRYAPYTGKSYNGIDDSRKNHLCSAEQPCNEVKGEQTDQPPVQTSDDGKSQGDLVNDSHKDCSFLEENADFKSGVRRGNSALSNQASSCGYDYF